MKIPASEARISSLVPGDMFKFIDDSIERILFVITVSNIARIAYNLSRQEIFVIEIKNPPNTLTILNRYSLAPNLIVNVVKTETRE